MKTLLWGTILGLGLLVGCSGIPARDATDTGLDPFEAQTADMRETLDKTQSPRKNKRETADASEKPRRNRGFAYGGLSPEAKDIEDSLYSH